MTLLLQSNFAKPGFRRFAFPAVLLLAACVIGSPAAPADPPKAAKAAASAPVKTNAVVEIPKSVFVIPTTPQEGKDPFFPNSTRLFAVTHVKSPKVATSADLVLKILSGTPASPLATINNWTFGVGEEADVLTPAGKVRVRCVEIRLNDEVVVVEVGGARRELRFPRRR